MNLGIEVVRTRSDITNSQLLESSERYQRNRKVKVVNSGTFIAYTNIRQYIQIYKDIIEYWQIYLYNICYRIVCPTIFMKSCTDLIFFTPNQVAKRLQLNVLTIYSYIKSSRLKAIKFGRSYRISDDELNVFIKNNMTGWKYRYFHKDSYE